MQKHSILGGHLHFDTRGHLGYTEPLIYSGPRFILLHLDRFILRRVIFFFPPKFIWLHRVLVSACRIFQFSSVPQLCPILCDPMDCSTPGFPVYHQLPEFTQTHVHRVGDAIQPSHPLSSPSPPALSLSQHQGLFQ